MSNCLIFRENHPLTLADKLEAAFAKLQHSNSLLKVHLTRQIFDDLKQRETTCGFTLLDVIQYGCENHHCPVGVYITDAECLTVFADLLVPIIQHYHNEQGNHPAKEFGNLHFFGNLDATVSMQWLEENNNNFLYLNIKCSFCFPLCYFEGRKHSPDSHKLRSVHRWLPIQPLHDWVALHGTTDENRNNFKWLGLRISRPLSFIQSLRWERWSTRPTDWPAWNRR